MQTASESRIAARRGEFNRLARLARALVHARMRRVDSGRLVIRDPVGFAEYGDPRSEAVEITVDDMSFYRDLCLRGGLGAASAYMNGKWRSRDLTALFRLFTRNTAMADGMNRGTAALAARLESLRHGWRRNTQQGSRRNIREHYDLGNDLFELFLDKSMTYSAAIYPRADAGLEEASRHKLDVICRKLRLEPQDHVLEIGSGWGSFAMHAASRYGCRVTTTTISDAQYQLAARRIRERGLEDRVTLLKQDYRELTGRYDKLVSIEMIEAVGHDNLDAYFGACARLLAHDGLMLVQVISMPDRRYARYLKSRDFIQRYIFPGSCCPSLGAMLGALGRSSDLRTVHLEDIAAHYARTLRDWRHNFDRAERAVREAGYSDGFIRLWRYYLSYCEAGFAEHYLSDYQILLARPGNRSQGVSDGV